MSLALRIAWRHLRSARAPRWAARVALVGLAVVLAGAAVIVAASLPAAEAALGYTEARLAGLGGFVLAVIGLLVLGFAAVLRRFTLLTAITLYSIAQGCAALVVVLSLLGGLEVDLRERLLGHQAHLRVSAPPGSEILAPGGLVEALRGLPEVAGVSPALEGPVMVRSGFARAGVMLVGVDPELHAGVSGLPEEVVEGDYLAFLEPELLPWRPFPGAEGPAPPPGGPDLSVGRDSVPGTGPEAPSEDAEGGGWEDPAAEIPRLRAAGVIPPRAEAAEDEAEGEDGGGWEDPAQEIPRLRAAGVIPPARPPVEPEPEEPAEPEPEPEPASPTAPERPVLVPVVIGAELAAELSVGAGDPLQLITPEGRLTPAGLVPGVLATRVAAVYSTGIYNDDHNYIYIPLADAQSFLRAPDAATALALRLRDAEALAAGKAAVAAIAGPSFVVEDWRQLHQGLFSAMFLEKVAMFIALLFVILVASFGILATNLMSVVERSAEIAILKAMGATDRQIAAVFGLEASLVGVLGCFAGVLAGLGLCAWFGERGVPLPSSAFTLQALPLRTEPGEVALVVAAALLLVGLASVVPARAAAALRPVQGLRRDE